MCEMIVYNSGVQSTFQDLGRYGSQSSGYSTGGAMDTFALRAANLLVGNEIGEACIEMLMIGVEVAFTEDTVAAVTGADMHPTINGISVPMWEELFIHKGDRLKIGAADTGMRSYLAVKGGFDIKPYLGSRSSGIQEKTGWNNGSPLKAGCVIGLRNKSEKQPGKFRKFRNYMIPEYYYTTYKEVRVIPGPFEDAFTEHGLDTFYNTIYEVGSDINRVGYRLQGEPIEQKSGAGQLISLSMTTGSIQVPGGGQPIILCVEHRTHGGYPVIGTVASTDMARIGQCRTGDRIHFKRITVEESHRNIREEYQILEEGKGIETWWRKISDNWNWEKYKYRQKERLL